jgi:dnd system-associated protein 4
MRRIQRDVCHEEFVKNLTTGDTALFKEIWRLLLFAAALGIKDGKRRQLEKVDSGKAMPDTYFSTPAWRGFLYLIGIAETGDSNCLRSTPEMQDNLVTAFEEYANYGLYLLRNRMQSSASILDEAISLLLEASSPSMLQPTVDDLI